MDVETMMKLNALSKELQKHGIAITSTDAVNQARVIVEESPLSEGSQQWLDPCKRVCSGSQQLLELPNAEHSEGAQECVFMETMQEQSKPSALQERRFELLLEMNNHKYDQELSALKLVLSAMSTQLEQMRLELKTLNERQLQSGTPKKLDKQEMLKTEVKEPHPRQGNYKPGDIDMQKMFYYGTGGPRI